MDAKRLKTIPLFKELSDKELQRVAQLADEVEVPEGSHLADEGRFAHEFFVIEEGKADVVHDGKNLAELGPGDFFGEIALIKTERRTASVIAKTPMSLIVMFGPNFRSVASDLPAVAAKINGAIEARCEDLGL
ncbi:MAG: cyclic nucleotide-binding domain-containing protein [Actinomycetota bacterium]